MLESNQRNQYSTKKQISCHGADGYTVTIHEFMMYKKTSEVMISILYQHNPVQEA